RPASKVHQACRIRRNLREEQNRVRKQVSHDSTRVPGSRQPLDLVPCREHGKIIRELLDLPAIQPPAGDRLDRPSEGHYWIGDRPRRPQAAHCLLSDAERRKYAIENRVFHIDSERLVEAAEHLAQIDEPGLGERAITLRETSRQRSVRLLEQ